MEAIKKVKGPCIILAGAGTGKTHTIVEKVKYLVENKIYSPEKIVCITFSNEAANNLYSRIKTFTDDKEPIVMTFHAFSADLLRKYGEKIGIKEDFSVLTPEDAKIVLHKYFRISPSKCHNYIATIGMAKDLGIKIQDIEQYLLSRLQEDDLSEEDLNDKFHEMQLELQSMNINADKNKRKEFSEKLNEFSHLKELKSFIDSWKAYERIKSKNNYQDYSDLNINALKLLNDFPEISREFDYTIVDEFQDTNKIQLDFLFKLALNGDITIVGDLNQSIYRFRGAYKKNFDSFKKHFNVSQNDVFHLDKSFRSPNSVLDVSHLLILKNYDNKEDCFEVKNHTDRIGEKIEVYEMKNAKEEARKVFELIKKEVDSGRKYEEICVLFRTHQQGRMIKNYLEYKQIPFSSVTKKSLLKQGYISKIIDILNVVHLARESKTGGEQFLWDLFYNSGFNQEDLIFLGKYLKKNKDFELSKKLIEEYRSFSLTSEGNAIMSGIIERLKRLVSMSEKKVSELIKEIYNVFNMHEDKDIILDLNKFYDLSVNNESLHYGDLQGFVNYLEILDNLKIDISSEDKENSGVRLMTSHSTKGLEFPVVIITNFAQKRFPIERITENKLLPLTIHPDVLELASLSSEEVESQAREYQKMNQILEERRLAYVSFTRAKEKLIITFADEYGGRKSYPSQFLQEINFINNPIVSLNVDNNIKYEEPELKITTSNNFSKIDFQKGLFDAPIVKKEKKINRLSPSSILLFKKCQKNFEYRYIFNMPEPKPVAWEEIMLGSFVHLILERGVKQNFSTEKEFIDFAHKLCREETWKNIDLNEAEYLIRIFYQRNKDKFNSKSKTEQILTMKISGMPFIGFADRIDFTEKGIEIIDYKTGKSQIPALNRNIQLGYYALAAKNFGKVKKVTLDTLRHEKPLEFEISDDGIAKCVGSERTWFDLYEVERDIVATASEIQKAIKSEFKACDRDKNCEFCEEYVYQK